MIIRFTVNLGSRDAEEQHLDYTKCQAGMELDVSDAVGAELIRRGLAIPTEIQAIPPKPEIGTVETATAELKRYTAKAKREHVKTT